MSIDKKFINHLRGQPITESVGAKHKSFEDWKEDAHRLADHITSNGKVKFETNKVGAGDKKWHQTKSIINHMTKGTFSYGVFNHDSEGSDEGHGHHLTPHDLDEQTNKESVEMEMNEGKSERTPAYKFTHKPGDADSEKKLADLKATKSKDQKVMLRGRLGNDNPNASKYGRGGSEARARDVKKADAKHFDVYVHQDWRKIAAKEAEQTQKTREKHTGEVKKIFGTFPKVLEKHGYSLAGHNEQSNQSVYTKYNKDRNSVSSVKVNHQYPYAKFHDTDSNSVHVFHPQIHTDTDKHEEHKKHLPVKFEAAVIKHNESPHYGHTIGEEVKLDLVLDFDKEIVEHDVFGMGNVLFETENYLEAAFESGIVKLNK